ncbi:hypothetical protein C2G38_2031872 [Gigaspora rosea]|uniref:Uncharacterized protein n=1 Tax=Gigaspora rosea TaxID=44941 RepID=A0A397VR99_9GLOM|nr:hypothetical protein C2G38_2031872 [Gigaspora rosea]
MSFVILSENKKILDSGNNCEESSNNNIELSSDNLDENNYQSLILSENALINQAFDLTSTVPLTPIVPLADNRKQPQENPINVNQTMPTHHQEQNIYLITNDRNWKNIFKYNWHFITVIVALTIISMFLIKNTNSVWQNNIDNSNYIWQYLYDKLYEILSNSFSDHIERVKHLHIGDTRIYQRTESAYKKIKTENRELETKIIITEKKLARKEQELKSEKEKNYSPEKKLKIAEDSNTNLTIGFTTTENELTRLKSEKEKNNNLEEKHKITQDINTTLTIKLAATEKELKRIKQELESEKVKNDNLQSEFKLTIEELKVTQDSNTNFTIKLDTIQNELKAAQVFNSDLQAKITTAENELKKSKIKIEALEKEVKILNKQRIKGEERKLALEKLSHGYRELQDTIDKINQEKFIEETKKHKDILEKVEESLNDYEEC